MTDLLALNPPSSIKCLDTIWRKLYLFCWKNTLVSYVFCSFRNSELYFTCQVEDLTNVTLAYKDHLPHSPHT